MTEIVIILSNVLKIIRTEHIRANYEKEISPKNQARSEKTHLK